MFDVLAPDISVLLLFCLFAAGCPAARPESSEPGGLCGCGWVWMGVGGRVLVCACNCAYLCGNEVTKPLIDNIHI